MLATRRHIGAMSRPSWAADSSALQSRSNQIRNDSGFGAVVGTPGTNPSSWQPPSVAGLTKTVAAISSERGIDFVDFRLNGTTSSTAILFNFEGTQQVVALTAEEWTAYLFLAVVGGTLANISTVQIRLSERDAAGSLVKNNDGSDFEASIGSVITRFSYSVALSGGVGTAFVVPGLSITCTNAAAVDVTLRIGMPHLHRGLYPLSPIRTLAAARTGVHVSAGR